MKVGLAARAEAAGPGAWLLGGEQLALHVINVRLAVPRPRRDPAGTAAQVASNPVDRHAAPACPRHGTHQVLALKESELGRHDRSRRIALASTDADVDGAPSSPSAPRAGRVAAGVPSTMPRRAPTSSSGSWWTRKVTTTKFSFALGYRSPR